jgi:hypothetical protein
MIQAVKSVIILKNNSYLSAFQKEGAKEEEPNEPGKRALLSLKSKACQKIAQMAFYRNFML